MPVQSKPIMHTMPESDEQVQREVEERMGTHPCIYLKLEGGDVITIAVTGSHILDGTALYQAWNCDPGHARTHPQVNEFLIRSRVVRHNQPPHQVLAVAIGNCPKIKVQMIKHVTHSSGRLK